ncbi:MAG: nitroreductase family protein [Deltaproteobacteria bacterium]|nr:nitroreductase family protein [Candidatus Zymogenaceae bacterium]
MIIPDLISRMKEPVRFDERPVDQGTIMSILDAARLAPSANNSQIWRFFIIRDDVLLRRAAALVAKPIFANAPTIIAACADPWIIGKRGTEQPFFMIDVPIALAHISLMAQESGVSVSLAFDFDEGALIGILEAPRGYRAVALIALGYAVDDRLRSDETRDDVARVV